MAENGVSFISFHHWKVEGCVKKKINEKKYVSVVFQVLSVTSRLTDRSLIKRFTLIECIDMNKVLLL